MRAANVSWCQLPTWRDTDGIPCSTRPSISHLTDGLNARRRRHAAISSNVANVDTPGYGAVDVSFAGTLRRAREAPSLPVAKTDERHLSGSSPPGGGPDAVVLSGAHPRRDGNTVDIDQEMAKLARNQIEYQFLAQRLAGKFKKLKEAITGGPSP